MRIAYIKDKWHQSQRGYVAGVLLNEMAKDKSIFCLSGDLGYGVFDKIRDYFPQQFISVGAAEQTMMDIAVGLAYEGKKVFTYTITPFYLRAFETIRTYIDYEQLPVCMLGSGRDDDYKHDGYSHNASNIGALFKPLINIAQYYPEKENIPDLIKSQIIIPIPCFISLKR